VASAPAVTPLTASAGVATFPDNAGDVEQLVQAADEVLLESKRNGRNRTTVSTKLPQDGPGAPPPRLAHQDR